MQVRRNFWSHQSCVRTCYESTTYLTNYPFYPPPSTAHFSLTLLALIILTANEAFADDWLYGWNGNIFKFGAYNACIGDSSVQFSNQSTNCQFKDYVSIGKGSSVGVNSLANDQKSGMVAIGFGSHAAGSNSIALGSLAKTKEGMGQAIAIGNNAGANSQSVALGADVFAHGKSSVAIGNDDIDDPNFDDKLPEQSITTIFKNLMTDNTYFDKNGMLFKTKYVKGNNNTDNRKFSPTYAGGVGSIAIGSRAVAAGNLSTSVGALSFALADHSTTLGMRAFVGQSATGGVAVGQESRVFAANSLAIGNFNEATSNGSMAYGYNARAVGEHSIAIGSMVAAGASFNAEKGKEWLQLYKDFNKNADNVNKENQFNTFNEKAEKILKGKNNTNTGADMMPLETDGDAILTIGNKDIKKTKLHGQENEGFGKNAIVIGGRSFALWENSLALGYSALADASNGFAIGSYAYAGNRATNAMAIGVRSYAEGVNSIALGYRARVQDEKDNQTITNGQNKEHYKGTNSIALGIESLAYLNNSVALGHQSKTDYLYNDLLHAPYTPKGSITIPTSAQSGVISVGSKGHERRVVNVASGYLDTDAANVGQLKSLEERVNLLTSGGAGINAPYLAVDQTSTNSEAKRITDGQKAVQNYERYVELAKQYATLLNRKANGKETFNQQSLDTIGTEVTKLGKNNNIATTANTITKIIEDLKKEGNGDNSKKDSTELKKKFDEWQKKIDSAVTTDNTSDKKSKLTNLSKDEIEQSNFNSNRAKGRDSIAFGFKANTDQKAEHAIAIGYKAEAKAEGAVAIGDTAVVEKNAGDSVALGKNSKAEAKKTALSSATIQDGTGGNSIKFSWNGAGTSTNTNGDGKKSIVSVGTAGQERVITHVAAGNVTATSTDAINGGQLYGVASVFSTMATGILGLEKADNGSDGFKSVSFTKLKTENGQDTNDQAPSTFKAAIDKNIETINKGLKFAGNNEGEFTHQLGAKITIKGDGTDLTSTAKNGEISFALNKETNLENGTNNNKVPTTQAVKSYIDKKVGDVSSTLQFEGDNVGTIGKVALKTQNLKLAGTKDEIKTSVEKDGQTVTIGLHDTFKNKVTAIETNVTKNTEDIQKANTKIAQNETKINEVKNKADKNATDIQNANANITKNAEAIKNQTIKYKANGSGDKTVKLSEGLDFKGDTNISVEAGESGQITHKLNPALKGINSIAKNKDDNGAKITLENDKITVNKKITGLEDGLIQANSKDAVTGGQLYTELDKKANKTLDNLDQSGKDEISKLAVQAIKAEKEPKTSSALTVEDKASEDGKSKTIKVGLNESQLITNLSKDANLKSPAENSPKLVTDKQVSEFIGGKKLIFTDSKNSRHENKLDSEFKLVGNSDITVSVSKDGENGNGQATFVLNKVTTIDKNTPNNGDKEKVATAGAVKTYVDNALTAAKTEADKTAVKYDDDSKNAITLGGKDTSHSPVEINNLRSGLGIDELKDSGITSAPQGKPRELVKDLVDGKLDEKAHKAANVSDLKAVATAGLNFAGNDNNRLVHKNLGETLQIVGKGVRDVNKFNATDNNILVKTTVDNQLEVALNAQLTGLQSATFANEQKTVKIEGDKIVLKDKADNGNSATYTADSATLKDENGNTAQLNGKGLTVGDKNSDADKTHTVYGKDGLTISGKDGKNAVSLTTKNENGKDAATLEFAKDKDGKAGTGAITGLKDLADNADGSSATNKNYVDNQLKKAKEDADKTAVKYDDDKKDAITLGGKGTSHKPVVIDNLRSGLGIDDINDGGIASIKQGKTRDLVKKLVDGNLDSNSRKAANVSDLKALATAGLNFTGNDAQDIHKNLGETLAIVGQGVTNIALFEGTDNNIAVKTDNDKLSISLNETLTAIKSLVTQAKLVDGNTGLSAISTLDGAGLHLTPAEGSTNGQGKQADYGLLGSTVKDGEKTNTQTAGGITLAQGDSKNMATATENTLQAKDAKDPTATLTNQQTAAGNTLSDNQGNRATYDRHGVSLKDKEGNTAKLDGQGLTVGDKDASNGDKTHATYGKNGLTINGKDGESAVSLTTKNDNGKDAATLAFAKDKDGKSGTGAITGLKDLADDADGSSATNKNYVDNQLKKAKEDADKTAVKYDDETRDVITLGGKGTSHKPVVIDNLRSGLGIDDIKDGGIASIKQGLTRDLVKKLVAGELDKDFSHKAANVSDLKALATAGLNFAGNDAKDIHKNLGETLAIVGQGVTDIALFKGTNNNIAVKTVAGNLEVSLNEALSAIKSLVTQTKSLEGNADLSAISTLDGAGLHLTPVTKDGNAPQKQADYGLLGSTLKDGEKTNTQTAGSITLALGEKSNTQTAESNTLQAKDAEDPTTTLTNKQTAAGNQISDNKGNSATYDRHGVSLQDQDKNSANLNAKGLTVGDDKGEDKTHATYGKNGLTIHGKDGQSAVSLTTENTHGKEAATLEFAKGEDGKAGTGAITGLKDLEASSDGSSAANKNYVDAQLSSALEEVAGNRPFDYYLNDIKVSKDKDGNFYKEEGGKKVKLTDVEKAQVVIKAEPQSTPMTVSNIKAAKLAENSTDAVNGAQLVAATGALAGQDGKMTFADGRDGKAATDPTAAANQGLTAKDGLNGHNANDKANALRNGEAGTVVYTDSAGQRLVKANDSKYYHAADVGRDGKPQGGKSAVENPQLSLVNAQGNTNNAALLGNVASGLGIKEPSSEEKQKIAALADVIKAKAGDVSTKAEAVSAKADVLSSLSDVVNAKEDAINAEKLAIAALPDGDDKTKAQTALKAKEVALETEKAKLATAKSELDKAKQNLSNAKAGLKVANDTYREALASVNNKIADLVNANSRATLTNAATVADLQAVARAGLNVVGNDGLTVHKHLGETLSITGEGEFNSDTSAAGNIKVELAQDGQGLSVKLSDKLQGMTSVETREIHGKKSLLDSNGLKTVSADSETRVSAQGTEIVGKGANAGKAAGYRLDGVRLQDGVNHATLSAQQGLRLTGQAGEPSLIATKNGLVVKGAQGDIALDGQRGEILLPNVKPDASGYVAVNKNYVDSQNNELRTQLSNTNREMRAGIAGALAAASLPSSAIPGKSMLAASAGAFKGHSAIALGYSKMSDNGKISIRLQGTSNSAGDLGGAVGVGYLW
ncbi:autotransporter adhesin [[Pasteurella] mairii]|uniref:Autotransporter adhesin n=1 Tax=[Pasteurella] mairii TaxID=757 RepID=A0A379B4V2_9PAST|nr:autotransporter adhesin [[Pasteurella] mairii]